MKSSRTRKSLFRRTRPPKKSSLKKSRLKKPTLGSRRRKTSDTKEKASPSSRRAKTRQSRRRWLLRVLGLLFLVLLGGTAASFFAMDREITQRFEGKRWRLPSKIYSDSFPVYPGLSLEKSFFFERLRRLGYQPARKKEPRKGEYSEGKNSLDLFLHDFRYPDTDFHGFPVRMVLKNGWIQRLQGLDTPEKEIYSVNLEPELITGLFQQVWEERRLVELPDVPSSLRDAVIAAEDQSFYDHFGMDWRAIVRATVANLKAGRVVQGASTLTQQLVKNFFLTPKKTLSRKIHEACMALILEVRYSKDQILQAYLNEIYFGQRGSLGVYGVGEASEFYFGKTVRELTLPESALLAGLIRAPNLYAPHKGEQKISGRRDHILKRMWGLGMITEKEYEDAVSAPVDVRLFHPETNDAPYFVDALVGELQQDYSLDILTSEGLRIFTSLDVEMQKIAEQSVREGLQRLETRVPKLAEGVAAGKADPLQACLVALEPQTGAIRAMVGGRDHKKSQFNRVVQSTRQPGSLFKPIAYITALEGTGGDPPRFTPASLVRDEPIEIRYDGKTWKPRNFNGQYTGEVTLRTALEKSLNCATAWLGERVGYERIIETARALGLTTPMDPVPSLVLGSFEVVPLEIASAFGVFANQGVRSSPRAIKTVLDQDGNVLQRRPMQLKQVVSPEAAFLMTNLLRGVFKRGTAAGVAGQIDLPVAGKTGTTNDYLDAWFVGYTSRLVALVWVGFDKPRSTGLSGAGAALPIWKEFILGTSGWIPPEEFMVPPGIEMRTIDRISGLLATSECPDTIEEAFIAGTQPVKTCPLHPVPEAVVQKPEEQRKKGFFERIRDLFD
jgi:penicillin-binding protein 1B